MKRISQARKSLFFSCAVYFACYTLIIILVYFAFANLANQKMSESVFTMEDLLSYEDELVQEDYAKIPAKNSKTSAIIIFDEDGRIQYASNHTISEKIFFQDLDMIEDYNSNNFFEVLQDVGSDGSVEYTVYLNGYEGYDMVPRVLNYCVLDEAYRIMEGGLFSDREYLTQREFELLSGVSRFNGTLVKYVYQNKDGEERTLAFLSTAMSDKHYNKIVESVNMIWLVGILNVFLIIIVFAALFFRKIKIRIAPLNQIITSYQRGKAAEIDPSAVPSEFHETVCSFKNLVEELERTREEKETLYKEKQKLVVDISHDLKTPLTVIQGYAKALSEGRVPAEKQAAYMESIFTKSKLATDMVNDLFMFTQMEHPNYQLHLEKTDFNEFVKSFFAEKYMEIEEDGFQLSAEMEDRPIPLLLDRKLMRRLLENLLSNAIKYNDKGTTIYIAMERRGDDAVMTLADDGVGIPEGIAESLFQPFVTGNRARTTGKGTGLGLSIAQRIVQMHRGSMELVRPPHKPYHTEFCIRIPLGESESCAEKSGAQ